MHVTLIFITLDKDRSSAFGEIEKKNALMDIQPQQSSKHVSLINKNNETIKANLKH